MVLAKPSHIYYDNNIERVAKIKGLNMSKEKKNEYIWRPEGIFHFYSRYSFDFRTNQKTNNMVMAALGSRAY